MKKKYESPIAERIKFEYRDQVVATSGCYQEGTRIRVGDNPCADGVPGYEWKGNQS